MAKKGQIFRKHSAEFKISVILDMRQNRSGLREPETYKEYEQKTADYTKDKWQTVNDGLMVIFTKFAECKNDSYTADSNETQALVKELQNYITENYYTCTNEILAGLGQMYVADERFKNDIDKHIPGTAEFVSYAIKIYCAIKQ